MQFISAFIWFIALMENFYAKARGSVKKNMRLGKGPRRTRLFARKRIQNNFALAPGIFSASIVGSIVFEVLLSVKYNLFFHFNVSVCCQFLTMRCFPTSAILKLTNCSDIECILHNYTSVMLSSDTYNKRVDEVHYFSIGKMTTL